MQCPFEFGCVAGVFLLRHCSAATRAMAAMAHSKAVDSKLSRASPMAPAGFTVGGPCNGGAMALLGTVQSGRIEVIEAGVTMCNP